MVSVEPSIVKVSGLISFFFPPEPKGYFLDNCQYSQPADHALDPKAAEKLWHLSEQLVGQEFK